MNKMAGCGEFHFSPLKKFWKSIPKISVKKSNLAKCLILKVSSCQMPQLFFLLLSHTHSHFLS